MTVLATIVEACERTWPEYEVTLEKRRDVRSVTVRVAVVVGIQRVEGVHRWHPDVLAMMEPAALTRAIATDIGVLAAKLEKKLGGMGLKAWETP